MIMRLSVIKWISVSFFPLGLCISAQVCDAQSLDQLKSLNGALVRSLSVGDQQAVNRLMPERAEVLYSLIQKSPGAVLEFGLATEARTALLQRGRMQSTEVETTGEWEGSVQEFVADDFQEHRSRSYFRFMESGQQSELYFAGTPPQGNCEHRMYIKGMRIRDRIAVESFTASTATSISCSTVGVQKTIAVLISMPSFPLDPQITASYVQAAFFGLSGRSLTNFWSEASYGKTSVTGTVFGPVKLPKDYTCTSIVGNQFVEDVIHAIGSSIDFSQYQRIFNLVPPMGCGWGGLGGVGCGALIADNNATFQASASLIAAGTPPSNDGLVGTIAHEGGHNLGLGHASSVDYGSVPLGDPSDSGTWSEYGDPFDVMGSSLFQYGAPHKQMLNWLPASNLANVTSDGSFLISPLEVPAFGIQGLRVRRGNGSQWLWLEYRQPLGLFDNSASFGSNVYSGAVIHYEDPSDTQHPGYSKLLDFTPGKTPNNFSDAALAPPGAWADPYSSLTLLVTGASSSGLSVSVNYDGAVFVNPSSTTFTWGEGVSGAPSAQIMTLTSTGRSYNYSATTSSSGNWLSVSQTNGSIPGNLQILANPAGLYAGLYIGTVSLTVSGAPNSPILIPVTLNIAPNAASPWILSVSPTSGSGSGQTFTAVFSDPLSYTNLQFADIIFGNSAANICHIRYDPVSASFELQGDSGSTWSTLLTPGSMGSIQNSQCILSGVGSSGFGSGTLLTVTVAVSFTLGFTGNQTIYGIAQNGAFSSGSQPLGTWTVNSTPAAVSAQPAWGAGLRQTFSFLYTDPNGIADFSWVGGQFSATSSSIINSCAFYSYAPYGYLGLWDDAAQNPNWLALGSNSSVQNSVCTIFGATSFASQNGNNVILTLDVAFAANGSTTLPLYLNGSGKSAGMSLMQAGNWETSSSPLTVVTIQTNPPGLQFSLDGGPMNLAPMKFNFLQGTLHTLAVATTQPCGAKTRCVFNAWSDSGAATHSIAVGMVAAAYTASFKTQYQLNISASPVSGGTVTPASGGFFDAGTAVPISATAASGYFFSGWSGNVTSAGSGSTTVTMIAGQTIVASFSTNIGVPSALGAAPMSGSGFNQTFTFTFSDVAGWQALGIINVLVNNYLDGRQACYVAYVVQSNSLLLVDDSGDAGGPFAGGMQLNGSGSVSNNQCAINGVGSSAVGTGNTLTLTLNVGYSSGFAGNKVMYLAARDTGTGSSGWHALGTWTVPGAAPTGPSVSAVVPARSTAARQTFAVTFTDPAGFADITITDVVINNFLDGIGACYVAYVPGTNTVILVDDAGDAGGPYAGALTPGSGSASNSQCTVHGATSSVNHSGNTLTLTLDITFNTSFAGDRVIYAAAGSNAANSGWLAVGTESVP